MPHPIPYQGSKRLLAPKILECLPNVPFRLVEPFAGAAAVSLAVSRSGMAKSIILNDINAPLMNLWEAIIKWPSAIASDYRRLWQVQIGQERRFYDAVRERFNSSHRPSDLLYLLARCVKASVRYNAQGEFNQSPDNRRKGMRPQTMHWHILGASRLLAGKTQINIGDYREVLKMVTPEDVVYMDPPYQGVCTNRDPRYIGILRFDSFCETLRNLNRRGISFIVSYDGKTGDKAHGRPMPMDLKLTHIQIDAGRSSQATLLGRNSKTYESLYLSPALVSRTKKHLILAPRQYSLLAHDHDQESVKRVP